MFKDIWKKIAIIGIILILIINIIFLVNNYYYENKTLEWCNFEKPELNYSQYQICYKEPVWSEYCKNSYPQDCPNKGE